MRVPLLLIALTLCGQAYGYLIPLSGFRSVSASGIAGSIGGGGQSSYSETESLTGPLGAFDGSVSGFEIGKIQFHPLTAAWDPITRRVGQ